MKLISYPFKKSSISCSLSQLWDHCKPFSLHNTHIIFKITGVGEVPRCQNNKNDDIASIKLDSFWDLNMSLRVICVFNISNCLIQVFQDRHSLNSDSPQLWLRESGRERSVGESNSTGKEYCTYLLTPN